MRDASERSIASVHDAIRAINREVGTLASHVFEAIEDQEKVQRTLSASEREDEA